MPLNIHIEHLILEGAPFAASDSRAFRTALERELAAQSPGVEAHAWSSARHTAVTLTFLPPRRSHSIHGQHQAPAASSPPSLPLPADTMNAIQTRATEAFSKSPPSAAPPTRGLLQRKCACGGAAGPSGECADCQKKKLLQRRPSAAFAPATVPSIVHEVLRPPGQPLDPTTRAFMEPHLGHDFSKVRMHTDAKAAESARVVNALAFTVGRDIVFGEDQHALRTSKGQRPSQDQLGE